jgi:prolipoprotein diacylglyceryltransferase
LKVVFHYRACVYLIGVSIVRFGLEFFRGDMRGSIFGYDYITPQQWMSVVFALIGIALLFVARKNKMTVCFK